MCYVEVFVLLDVLQHPRHCAPVHVVDEVDIDQDADGDGLPLVEVLPPTGYRGEEKSVRNLNCVRWTFRLFWRDLNKKARRSQANKTRIF